MSTFRLRIAGRPTAASAALSLLICSHFTSPANAEMETLGPDFAVRVVVPISGDRILPDTWPVRGHVSSTLEVAAARGEYEPASFTLTAIGSDATDVVLTPGDLQGTSGQGSISKGNIDIRVVKPWFQGSSAWSDIRKAHEDDFRQVLVPELLLKDDDLVRNDIENERTFLRVADGPPRYVQTNVRARVSSDPGASLDEPLVRDATDLQAFSIPARTTKQIWVTVYVPGITTPGRYQGAVRIECNGKPAGELGMTAHVHPFDLPQSRRTHAIYYRGTLASHPGAPGSERKTAQQMRLELKDMREHGVTSPTVYQKYSDPFALAEVLGIRAQLGMNKGPLFYLGLETTENSLGRGEAEQLRTIRREIPALRRMAARHGFTNLYVYGRDEAAGAALARQRSLWNAVHATGGRIYAAGTTGTRVIVGDILDTFVHYGQPDGRVAGEWHQAGQKVLSYSNPQTGPENPYLFRLNYGLILWANNYDGAMPYAYQHCFGSCWNDSDHPTYRDHNLTYPTVVESIPTLAWEGLREAIDDTRYLELLESLVSQGWGAVGAREAAMSFLEGLRITVRGVQGRSGVYNENARIDLDSIRSTVVMHVLSLSQTGERAGP